MAQRESKLSRKILDALRARDIFCFKVHGGPTMMVGLPDIVACVGGRFVGLEVKLPENREGSTERQRLIGARIMHAGGAWSVVCSVAEALAVVEELS